MSEWFLYNTKLGGIQISGTRFDNLTLVSVMSRTQNSSHGTSLYDCKCSFKEEYRSLYVGQLWSDRLFEIVVWTALLLHKYQSCRELKTVHMAHRYTPANAVLKENTGAFTSVSWGRTVCLRLWCELHCFCTSISHVENSKQFTWHIVIHLQMQF